ncbi:uncharacterized mitochondrial protein AtMg00810-like [Juglans microcarpa x Juglans regia]|uniref:uncharacterized mitochondrial protein AtMg00810-like n=1 Tax=Juglans microcarpa x Juglans regia TaxID=2249226 RepID=UPI001B7E2CCE|nr:uncharacterized mitochondrial protein AtMg00810-like [Juglans microcarpa x Juglans regia]
MSNPNIRTDEFSSNDQIQIGDGTCLKITHIGTTSISNSSSTFLLFKGLVFQTTEKLQHMGFVGSKADNSLFTLHKTDFSIFLLIYVDDIIITGTCSAEINLVIQQLGSIFPVKDLGKLSYFLGVEVLFDGHDLYLSQRKYVANLLQRVNMHEAKPCSTPMSTTYALSKYDGTDFSNLQLYRSTVGALHYLDFTRPDIAFAVHRVSKFMHQHKNIHWQAVKCIIRYLKFTVGYALHFHNNSDHSLQGFSDADWAADKDDRRSVGAYCIFHG